MDEAKYFSVEELRRLTGVESQQLKQIKYHYWVNSASDPATKVLDFIELVFIDNESLMLIASELCDAIEVGKRDVGSYASELLAKFNNRVRIRTEDMTDFPLWEKVIEYALDEVLLDRNETGDYFSDKLLLRFGPLIVQIEITELGLLVSENKDHLN